VALVVRLDVGPDGPSGTLDVPLQRARDVPLDVVLLDADTVRFTAPDLPAAPTFTGRRTGDVLEGDLVQGAARLPFRLERAPTDGGATAPGDRAAAGDASGLALPGAAAGVTPRPYAETEVAVAGPAGPLAGTLTLPRGLGPHPVALLLSTSGAQDRDGRVAGHPTVRTLADALTRAGIATLRFDDRGVGGSAGTYADAGLDGLTADALAALAWIPRRSDLAADRVAVVGHGLGGIVAARATLAAHAPARRLDLVAGPVADPVVPSATVLLAAPAADGLAVAIDRARAARPTADGPSADAEATYLRQLHAAFEAGDAARATALARAWATRRLQARPAAEIPTSEADRDRIVAADVRDATAATARDALLAEPADVLAALPGPALGVYGGRDVQVVAASNAAALRAAWASPPDAVRAPDRPPDRPTGVPHDRDVVVLAGVTHALRSTGGSAARPDGAGEDAVAPGVGEAVTAFLAAHLFGR
jgi:alpha/beta superfamily hydrolase